MSTSVFGRPILRREDYKFLCGAGRYLDDISVPGLVHVVFLRSSRPHAVIRSIEASAARAACGVLDVVTATDLGASCVPFPQLLMHKGLVSATWCALAPGRVRYVGEPIAAVVADTVNAALDAVETIKVDYELLPAVLDIEEAIKPGVQLVHDHAPGNFAMRLTQKSGAPDAARHKAQHWIKDRMRICRGAGMPLEMRGVIAKHDPHSGELTVWSSTQEPHTVRDTIAAVLSLRPSTIRVITPDTGGGFGTKINVYPEEVLIPWLALRLGRPVKWVETRGEHMIAAQQERDQVHDVEVGFDTNGTIIVLKDSFLHDAGAYTPRGGSVPHNTSSVLPGPYRIPNLHFEMTAVYTNKVPVSAYRGAGQPQGTFVMERLIDRIARHLDKDPAEVRRLNTIPVDAFPYDTGLTNLLGGKVEYDSGNFGGVLEQALQTADYWVLRAEQRAARQAGRLFGIGIGSYVELTGRGPWEGSGVRIERDGRVIVYTGAPSQGQGLETTLAQICADYLGASFDKISVIAGDTAMIPHGIGTFASRVGVLAGNAVRQSAAEVKNRVLRIAADLLEASEKDLEVTNSEVRIVGVAEKKVSFAEIAQMVRTTMSPDPEASALDFTTYFKGPKITYSNGTHIACVEVDADTGEVTILKYVIAHDCGRMINPTIVEGQIQGGFACGLGNALLEQHVYDANGQLLTGSFMDYAMPRATDIPNVTIVHQETPSTLNPLGIKGAGEAGTIPVTATLCNAIEDALRPLGIDIAEAPLTPYRLWQLITNHCSAQAASRTLAIEEANA